MTALDLYYDLTEQGFNFWLEQGALKCHAPKGKMTADILTWLKIHKRELISLLASNDSTPQTYQERYRHLITCQQCEHLTAIGYCRVKPQYKPMLDAMRDCGSFERVSGERVAISQTQTYTATELLTRCEEFLFNHLLDCSICHIERGEYCLQGKERGKAYDNMLLEFDDIQPKRESLALRTDKAIISSSSVFGGRK